MQHVSVAFYTIDFDNTRITANVEYEMRRIIGQIEKYLYSINTRENTQYLATKWKSVLNRNKTRSGAISQINTSGHM